MWIRTQKGESLVNTDNIARLYIKFNNQIYAEEPHTYGEGGNALKSHFFLGMYDKPDAILESISMGLMAGIPVIALPNNEATEIDNFVKKIDELSDMLLKITSRKMH